MESQEDQEGYVSLPKALLQALAGKSGAAYAFVLFVAQHTMGRQHKIGEKKYRVKEVCLSYDEFIHGRHKRDGTRMPETSGLKDDKAVQRGYEKAKAYGLIEVTQEGQRNVRVYTIPDRFWQAANFEQAIKMLADNRIPDSYEQYYLVSTFTAGKMTADETQEPENDASTAGKSAAVPGQNASSHRNNASSSAVVLPAEVSRQPAPEQAPQERKHTSQHRVNNIDMNIDAASATPSPPSISLAQSQKEEHEDPAAAMTTRKQSDSLQAEQRSERNTAPGRGKEDMPPAPTAEVEQARERQRIKQEIGRLHSQRSELVKQWASLNHQLSTAIDGALDQQRLSAEYQAVEERLNETRAQITTLEQSLRQVS